MTLTEDQASRILSLGYEWAHEGCIDFEEAKGAIEAILAEPAPDGATPRAKHEGGEGR